EAIVSFLLNCPMKDWWAPAWAAGAIANAVNATAPTATAEALMARWIDDMSQYPFPVVPYWLTPRGLVDKDDGLRRRRAPPRAAPLVRGAMVTGFELVVFIN